MERTATLTTTELLAHLRGLGAEVWAEDGRLRYRAPVGTVDPALRTELAARKAEILDLLRAERSPRLGALPRPERLPLSFAQERMWFFHQLAPESPVYTGLNAFVLRGPLDAGLLQRALAEVARRHEILRTTFSGGPEGPAQAAGSESPFEGEDALPVLDDREAGEAWLGDGPAPWLVRELARPFDIERGPLLRALLVRTGDEEHALLMAVHHLVSDGLSTMVLLQEAVEIYRAGVEGRAPRLPELPLQYADFALWQRAVLEGGEGEALESRLAWWRERLEGAPEVLELPVDRPRPEAQSFAGGRVPVDVPPAAAARLRVLAQGEGATLYMAGLAAFAALLRRWTGRGDLVLGTPVTDRQHRSLEGLIGCFVNTVALRLRVEDETSGRELVRAARAVAAEAFAHQDLPFEKLVEALRPQRAGAHPPVVQVGFSLGAAAPPPMRLGGLELSPVEIEPEAAPFDLWLEIAPRQDGGLGGFVSYSAELFDRPSAVRVSRAFARLVDRLTAAPDSPAGDLPLLDDAERHQLFCEWNETDRPAAGLAVHERFTAWAAAAPEAVALEDGTRQTTYAELADRAAAVTRMLCRMGIGPEAIVGVQAERSPDTIAALLGVLGAGAAFLALDPAQPAERLAGMLESAGAALVLARPADLAEAAERAAVRRVSLVPEDEGRAVANGPSPDPLGAAYLIFTSGSTGRPKGVIVPHGGLTALAASWAERCEIGPGSRVLQFAPLSFDASVLEVCVTLSAGATLCLAEAHDLLPGPGLAALLADRGITYALLPPSVVAALPESLAPSSLRTLAVGGEACPASVAAEWSGRVRLINAYGPTEITVVATTSRVEPGRQSAPPIGRPLPGVRVAVLDREGRPLPVGVPGQLAIGGVGVARGYAGAPALTAERFVPDPFAAEMGSRLYLSGDLVRWRPDGALESLGRIDQQLKVRGVRIEPAEVEAALCSVPGIVEAAVAARPDSGGTLQLVAWVAGPRALSLDPADLRSDLAAKLPPAMIPSVLVPMEELPRTASGKVDRRALAVPEGRRMAGEGAVPPQTPMQRRLAEIWEQLLEIEGIGIHDRFFEVGGHSLQSMRLLARLRDAFGVEVPVRSFFARPTIAGLEELIEGLQIEAVGQEDADSLLAMIEELEASEKDIHP